MSSLTNKEKKEAERELRLEKREKDKKHLAKETTTEEVNDWLSSQGQRELNDVLIKAQERNIRYEEECRVDPLNLIKRIK